MRDRGPEGVRGWLLVLVAVFLIWEPVEYGVLASTSLPMFTVRGPSLLWVLTLKLLVVALGMAAGIALAGISPAAVPLARTAAVLFAATDLFVYATPYLPNNRMPGDTPIYIAVSLAFWAAWFVYLLRSRRVRNTYE